MQAELSISNENNPSKLPPTSKDTPESNTVKMVYSFSTNNPKNTAKPVPEGTSYGFQRGNMIFTSTPPFHNVQDSGYNSDHLFSSTSQNSSRTYAPYERRCKSTYNITLQTDVGTETSKNVQSCDIYRPCYFVERIHCLPNCEECKRAHSFPSSTYSSHFCTKVPEKQSGRKDMMTQTVETKEKCTSPLEKILDDNKSDSELSKFRKKNVRDNNSNRKKSNVIRRYSDLGDKNVSTILLRQIFNYNG